MKKIFLVLALVASMQVFDAQAQVKSPSAAKSAVEKAEAATTNPKQSQKPATWIKYGKALLDAYDAPAGNLWVGMSRQELQVLGGSDKPLSESVAELGGRQMTKVVFENKNLYFNENGLLEVIEVTKPVVEGALDKALSAYAEAAKLDPANKKKKDISAGLTELAGKYASDAYNAYAFGKMGEASISFEKAAAASATAPLSQIDTNSIYNAGFTAQAAGDNARAKEFYTKCLSLGYHGTDGDTYAKMADVCDKLGDKETAKNYLEEGFKAHPQSQSILVGLINYYVTSGSDTDRLFELLDEAKKNEPNNASLYYVEGNINEKLGKGDAAVASYRKCAEINPAYEFGYIGEGIHFYNLAVAIQDKASLESDDAKYMAMMGEFETALKSCIAPFEKAFELSSDPEVKSSVAEYLKNACFRFRTESPEMQAKYEKYAAATGK